MTLTYAGNMADDEEDRWPPGGRLAVDLVMFTERDGELAVLAVERARAPFAAALALPGGFVEAGERAPEAAVRELAEETGIEIGLDGLRRFASYGEPGRDPRGRVVSIAFHGYLSDAPAVAGGSDARDARWVGLADFLASGARIAFDHRDIVADAVSSRFGRQPATSG